MEIFTPHNTWLLRNMTPWQFPSPDNFARGLSGYTFSYVPCFLLRSSYPLSARSSFSARPSNVGFKSFLTHQSSCNSWYQWTPNPLESPPGALESIRLKEHQALSWFITPPCVHGPLLIQVPNLAIFVTTVSSKSCHWQVLLILPLVSHVTLDQVVTIPHPDHLNIS